MYARCVHPRSSINLEPLRLQPRAYSRAPGPASNRACRTLGRPSSPARAVALGTEDCARIGARLQFFENLLFELQAFAVFVQMSGEMRLIS